MLQIDRTRAPNISSVATLLKLYFRELPEPLFTSHLYPLFMEAASPALTEDLRIQFFRGLSYIATALPI